MLAKWNAKAYGEQNAKDLWGQIQEQVNKGWYVPSRAEWAAFGGNLRIDKSNWKGKGLSEWYWSSSQYTTEHVCYVAFNDTFIYYQYPDSASYVRLGTTF